LDSEVRLCADVTSLSTFAASLNLAHITDNDAVDNACRVVPLSLFYINAESGKRSHGAYVSCVANAVFDLRKSGAINKSEGGALIRTAAKSGVNK